MPGIQQQRKCRDVIFLLLFVVYWIGMFIVAQSAVASGDIRKLTYGTDSLGNFCGQNNTRQYGDQTNKPYTYYLNPMNVTGIYICVQSCPNATTLLVSPSSYICQYDVAPTLSNSASLIAQGKCVAFSYKSSPTLNRCLPSEPIPTSYLNTSITVSNYAVNTMDLLSATSGLSVQIAQQLNVTWPLIAVAVPISFILTYLWIGILHFFSGFFVWLSIIAVNLIAILSTIFVYLFWKNQDTLNTTGSYNSVLANGTTINFGSLGSVSVNLAGYVPINTATYLTTSEIKALFNCFIVLCVVTVLIFLITIAMIKRVNLAIQILNLASHVFRRMPTIFLFPLGIIAGLVLIGVYFVAILLYLLTPTSETSISFAGYTLSGTNLNTYMIWYHLAGCIWACTFLLGVQQLTIAGAAASYYWVQDKTQIVPFPITKSFYRTCRYHLGSVALGSLLITIIELIRLFLYQLQAKVAKSKNPYLKYIVACAQCCMKCIEMVVKWINRNAYVYIAITGVAFFKAAGHATSLLLRNGAKLVAVSFVADFSIFLTKITIAGLMGLIAYWILGSTSLFSIPVSSSYLTVIICGLVGFFIASSLMSPYHTTIDTIFLSVLQDLEENDGSPEKPYFMTEEIKKVLGKKNKIVPEVQIA
ncbi:plasma-membrane choline transporter-domain-containing protein [Gorgonomyces haynaldii]|nr:plasma-membrane choline transporter-domain-containing protein [Gorgonomyces haynaldii]